MSSVLEHIQSVAREDPVEAATMLVQSTTRHDPADPLKLPWSVDSALIAYRRIVGPLDADQEATVREAVRER